MEFPIGENGESYYGSGRGPVGIKYFNSSRNGWVINNLVYNVDSEDVESVIGEPEKIRLTSTRFLFKFKEFMIDG